MRAQPDITMPELAADLLSERNIEAASASISRVLRKAGFTYEEALMAAEHGRADVAERRREWIDKRRPRMRETPGVHR